MSVVLHDAVLRAEDAQRKLAALAYCERVWIVERYTEALASARQDLVTRLSLDAHKTIRDATAEVEASIDSLRKSIRDTQLPDLADMQREKRRTPAGLVGLITSFNFPMVVAHWTIGPALLAGNAVLWKPSEKTPGAAILCKKIFDAALGEYAALLQVLEGARDVGEALVAHEQVDMISATGSVAMGQGIRRTLAAKRNNALSPILELGGNNAVVIGQAMSDAHLDFALNSLLSSFLGTTGQRCTNTRRLIVPRSWLEKTVLGMERLLREFIAGPMRDADNIYGYNRLIDEDAEIRFQQAKDQAAAEGGTILFGGPGEPAIAVMPMQTALMHHETFAPLLYIVPYDGAIESAMALVNEPENAGLVNGLYTLSKTEAEIFAQLNQAGHSVINSPKGTGTPAFGMGFGGNKESGSAEILWSADPLAAFTRPGPISRIAIYKNVPIS